MYLPIIKCIARQILSSDGRYTVEVELRGVNFIVRSSCPIGTSTGENEAKFLVDKNGRTVSNVVDYINSLSDEIIKQKFDNLADFDSWCIAQSKKLDKRHIVCNFTLPLSLCFCKYLSIQDGTTVYQLINDGLEASNAAMSKEMNNTCNEQVRQMRRFRIPSACFNVLNGGAHSGNRMSCQEIMVNFASRRADDQSAVDANQLISFKDQLDCASRLYSALKDLVVDKYGSIYTGVGKEGGFMAPFNSLEDGLELILKSYNKLYDKSSDCDGLKEQEMCIFLDFAANQLYNDGVYKIDGKSYKTNELCDYYTELVSKYPMIAGIEDPFSETDLDGWKMLYERLGKQVKIISDDLTVTSEELIDKYGGCDMFNTVLIKPNQVGTVTGLVRAVNASNGSGCGVMVSHRSSETEDVVLCSLAVGMEAEYIKCGAPSRERVLKYNELLRIESDDK